MKRLTTLATLCVLAALTLPAAARVKVIDHVPKETNLIVRMDADQLRASPLATELLANHRHRVDHFQRLAREFAGLDTDTITEIWFLSPEKDRGYVVMHGTFSSEELADRFGKLPGVEVERRAGLRFAASFPDDKSGTHKYAALIDRETLVVGDTDCVEGFLAGFEDAGACFPASHPKLQRLARAEAPFVATILPEMEALPNYDAAFMFGVESVWLEGNIGEDIALTLTVQTRQAAQATALAALTNGLCAYKATDTQLASAQPLITAALADTKASASGTTMTVALLVPGQQIQKRLAARAN